MDEIKSVSEMLRAINNRNPWQARSFTYPVVYMPEKGSDLYTLQIPDLNISLSHCDFEDLNALNAAATDMILQYMKEHDPANNPNQGPPKEFAHLRLFGPPSASPISSLKVPKGSIVVTVHTDTPTMPGIDDGERPKYIKTAEDYINPIAGTLEFIGLIVYFFSAASLFGSVFSTMNQFLFCLLLIPVLCPIIALVNLMNHIDTPNDKLFPAYISVAALISCIAGYGIFRLFGNAPAALQWILALLLAILFFVSYLINPKAAK